MRTLSPLHQEFEQAFESFLQPAFVQPNYEVSENPDHFLVSFEVPGVKTENLKVEVKAKNLIVAGERRELRSGRPLKFERIFALPGSVNTEKIEAQYEDGILRVALPKEEPPKAKAISIQTTASGFFSKVQPATHDGARVS